MKIINSADVPSAPVAMEGAAGAHRQLPIGRADGAPSFSLRVFTLEPLGHTPFHNHAWEHENYVIEGEGVVVAADGSERPVKTGDFVLVLPNEKHQYRNTSPTEKLRFICAVPKEYE